MTVPGKCHFDADGWLRGPISITHYLSPNHYASGFDGPARGMVQHTEDGYTAGTEATFMDPATEVSAFFGVGEDGAAQQFLPLGHRFVAWAQESGNPYWRSCECEDKTRTGQPMTAPQVAAFAQILEACSAYDDFPLVITDNVSGTGLITHGDGGIPWGDHPECPGDVRKAQRPELIRIAKAIRAGEPPKPPKPKPKLRREGPMLLNSGAGAATPVAIPEGVTALRFCAAGTAELSVEFHGQADILAVALSWAGAEGSRIASPPAGCHAARVTRTDAGTGDVDVAAE